MDSLRVAWRLLFFAPRYVLDLLKANLRLALDILYPEKRLSPHIIKVPLHELTMLELFLISNLLSITPGTLTLGVEEDNEILVHVLSEQAATDLLEDFIPRFYSLMGKTYGKHNS